MSPSPSLKKAESVLSVASTHASAGPSTSRKDRVSDVERAVDPTQDSTDIELSHLDEIAGDHSNVESSSNTMAALEADATANSAPPQRIRWRTHLIALAATGCTFTSCGIDFAYGCYQEFYEDVDGPFKGKVPSAQIDLVVRKSIGYCRHINNIVVVGNARGVTHDLVCPVHREFSTSLGMGLLIILHR